MKNYGNLQSAKEGWFFLFDHWFKNPGSVRKHISDNIWLLLKGFRNAEDVTSLQELLSKIWEALTSHCFADIKDPEGFQALLTLIEA